MTDQQSQLAQTRRAATTYVEELWSRREFAWYMALGNLRSRNASTALGLVWWGINPMLMGAVYYLVFGIILGVSRDLAYLLSGVFVFYFTSTAITTGANAIIQNRPLLVNLRFPRLLMPLTALLETSIGFLASIPALYLIIGPSQGAWPSLQFLWLFPLAFIIQSVLNLGLASLVARIAVPFRDVTNIVPHLLRIWLYLSPILFSLDQLENAPTWALQLFQLNPMVPILATYRSAMLGYEFNPGDLFAAATTAAVIAGVSIFLFIKYEGKMARYL